MLWIAQLFMAICFIWAGYLKLFQPIEKLSAMWPWTGQVPPAMVKGAGIVDLLGALGLIIPSLFRIQPKLTPVAALGIIVLMVCASIFHVMRGETSLIGVNIFFAIVSAFIAWGRFTRVPIISK